MKICIWTKMPTHYNMDFYNALMENLDLEVRYYGKVTNDRIDSGWHSYKDLPKRHKYIDSVNDGIASLPDWKNRIHIISDFSHFNKDLIKLFIESNIGWVHWGERSAINLSRLVYFNDTLYRILYPLFLWERGYKKYAKLINMYALGSFAVGQAAKKDFMAWGITKNKIELLPYSARPISIPEETPFWLSNRNEKYFVYLGSLNKRKGIDILLKAFRKLNFHKQPIEWKLVLAGKDESNGFYCRLVKKYDLLNKVIFTGHVKADEINKHIYYADVFVLPSLFDGWGVVMNEAVSIGKPIISTTKAGASHHLIKSGESGFIVKAKDADAFKNAMQFYIDNPDFIKIHGKISEQIFQNYTTAANVIRFMNAINKWT